MAVGNVYDTTVASISTVFDKARAFRPAFLSWNFAADAKPFYVQIRGYRQSQSDNVWATSTFLVTERGCKGSKRLPVALSPWWSSKALVSDVIIQVACICVRKGDTTTGIGQVRLHLEIGKFEGTSACPKVISPRTCSCASCVEHRPFVSSGNDHSCHPQLTSSSSSYVNISRRSSV